MCGFNGIYFYERKNINQNTFNSIRDTQFSRGPDAGGSFSDEKVMLGHRRLSIIDLTAGDQPMADSSNGVVVAYNGEIYNFLKIREELVSLGIVFRTRSDTEVLIECYKKWGIDETLAKIEGMYAFALWDRNNGRLYLARDKFGEKPLYYARIKEGIVFSSELKGLLAIMEKKTISKIALNLFLSLSYIPSPYTIYNDVLKIEAGHYLEIAGDNMKDIKYYNPLEAFNREYQKGELSYEDAKNRLRNLLNESVRLRMISDVPIGAFLSGGIDSSIISALMAINSEKQIRTFSIGFTEKTYDESERAKLVAEHIKSDHHSFIIDHTDLLKVVDKTLAYFDEPFADSSAIPSMIVAEKASSQVKVVLTGDGADELFGGYEKYLGKYYAEKYNNVPKLIRKVFEIIVKLVPHIPVTDEALRKIKKVIKSSKFSPVERYIELCSLGFDANQKANLLNASMNENVDTVIGKYFNEKDGDELSKTFYSDLKLILEGDMLTKVDRACMLNSLEARVPFLDSKIVEFSAALPHDFKIERNNKKKILKDAFADLLPDETLKFRKSGFSIPIGLWFQKELKQELINLLSEERLKEQNIFNVDYVKCLLTEHFRKTEDHGYKLWTLYVFQKWYNNTISDGLK